MSNHGGDPAAIDLWTIDLDRWSDRGTNLDSVSPEDSFAAARIKDAASARRLLARRSATRHVLGMVLGRSSDGVTITRSCNRCGSTGHGRPGVSGESVRFSVASSGAIAIVAVLRPGRAGSDDGSHARSDDEDGIGVDVELVVPGAVRPQRALSRTEQVALGALPRCERDAGFLQLWTAKEAVLKAGGRTLADDPSTVEAGDLLIGQRGRVDGFGTPWCVQRITVLAPGAVTAIVSVADRAGVPVALRQEFNTVVG